jgi:TetR/AcrR family transcriptional repressor of nem operon
MGVLSFVMAGKIAFDYDRAVGEATKLFWKNGYADTGLRDLLKAMGIGEGSFYNTIGSKKKLFLTCLVRYEETVVADRMRALNEPRTAAEGIRAFFRVILDCLDDPETPSRLCMLAAMSTEEVLAESDLRTRAADGITNLRTALRDRITADGDVGVLSASFDPTVVAGILATYVQGMWRVALVSYNRAEFERQIEALLAGVGL